MKTIICSDEDLNTIYTALRLELERNWGGDESIVNLLNSAISAVQAASSTKRV